MDETLNNLYNTIEGEYTIPDPYVVNWLQLGKTATQTPDQNIIWQTNTQDSAEIFLVSGSTITIPSGTYLVNGSLSCFASAAERGITLEFRYGSTVLLSATDGIATGQASDDYASASISGVLVLAAGNYTYYASRFSADIATIAITTHASILKIG